MFQYYAKATVCYAYLEDVSERKRLAASQWFRRGWTLQELVAPSKPLFLDQKWRHVGSKHGLRHDIAEPSGVDEGILAGKPSKTIR